jgi:pimeloyl-ACP methyl ester carboxylesterase
MAIEEKTIEAGGHTWFYREVHPIPSNQKSPVLLLHGLLSQSYTWTEVLPELEQQRFHAIAPDWLGCGNSDKPSRQDFAYTPDAFVDALSAFVDALELETISIVVQGFLASAGLQYALRNPDRIESVALFNTPIATTNKLPWKIQQLGFPLVGEMLTQDPLVVDRVLEKGSGYVVPDGDLDVYRRPFLISSDAGRSLFAIVRNLQLKKVLPEIVRGFSDWEKPTLIGWGENDPWLPMNQAEAASEKMKSAFLVKLESAGHYPQEHWSGKVNQVLLPFLVRKEI